MKTINVQLKQPPTNIANKVPDSRLYTAKPQIKHISKTMNMTSSGYLTNVIKKPNSKPFEIGTKDAVPKLHNTAGKAKQSKLKPSGKTKSKDG